MMATPARKQRRNMNLDRDQRACASLAHIAKENTIWGGCSAAVLANRAEAMGCKFPAQEVVADVYSASTGKVSRRFGVWECPECGRESMGAAAAWKCCLG